MEEENKATTNPTALLYHYMKEKSKSDNAYITIFGEKMEHEHALDRIKMEMLIYNTNLDELEMQVLKHVMKLSFTDLNILTKYAQTRARLEPDKNIFTNPDAIKAALLRLKSIGLILVKKYRMDLIEEDYDKKKNKDRYIFYFLSGAGARMLKEKTKETDFIEDNLFMKTDNEIMSRCAVNNIILDTAPYFPTKRFFTTITASFNKMERQVIYGILENKENIVVYEAVFFGDDMTMVTPEAQDKYINKRDIFLSVYFAQERFANKKKSFVMVLETSTMAEKSYKLYNRTISAADSVYIITESGIDYVRERLNEKTINAYIRYGMKEDTDKFTGEKIIPRFLLTTTN